MKRTTLPHLTALLLLSACGGGESQAVGPVSPTTRYYDGGCFLGDQMISYMNDAHSLLGSACSVDEHGRESFCVVACDGPPATTPSGWCQSSCNGGCNTAVFTFAQDGSVKSCELPAH